MSPRRKAAVVAAGAVAGGAAVLLPEGAGLVLGVALLGVIVAAVLLPDDSPAPGPDPAVAQRLRRLERRSARTLRLVRRLDRRDAAETARRTPPSAAPAPGLRERTETASEQLDALVRDGDHPSVVLVLQSLQEQSLYAGVRTAVLAAAELAVLRRRPLRVIVLDTLNVPRETMAGLVRDLLASREAYAGLADSLRLDAPDDRDRHGHHAEDDWVVTYWTTAWQLGRQVRMGRVDPARVVHLVQDWEPAFHAWGEEHVMVRGVYDHGFTPVVNSRSLADYVERQTGRAVDPRLVFAPDLDLTPLHDAAHAWKPDPDGTLRVLYYARPSKPRNLYPLGLAALQLWAATLPDDLDVVVRLAGEDLGGVDLGHRLRAEVLGKLDYAAYYDVLAETDLGLALMCSPHPGHLALELPAAGIPTVTNPFEGFRTPWIEGLHVAARAEADALASALGDAHANAASLSAHRPATPPSALGGRVADAVAAAAARLP